MMHRLDYAPMPVVTLVPCATAGCTNARQDPRDDFCTVCRADIEDFARTGKVNK